MFFKRESNHAKLKKQYEDGVFKRVRNLQEEHLEHQKLSEIVSVETDGGIYYRTIIEAKYKYLYKVTRKIYADNKKHGN